MDTPATRSVETVEPTEQTADLPALLREDSALGRRLPTLTPALRRVWARYLPQPVDRPGWPDVWAVVLLAASTIYLVVHDGGRPRRSGFAVDGVLEQVAGVAPVLILCVPVLMTSIGDVARDRPLLRWLLAAWPVGAIVALAAADVRDGWVRAYAAFALAVPLFLAARRVWRARWGPPVFGTIAVLAGVLAWLTGVLRWTASVADRYWPLLSWHNQTATLMGAFALAALAVAWAGRRWVRAVGIVLAVLSGSALWLAASRGAFVLTLLGLAVALAVALRSPYARAAVVTTVLAAAMVVPTVLAVSELRAEVPTAPAEEVEVADRDSARALLDRGTDLGNLEMRFTYWRGAMAMFASAPLAGTGPGSFPEMAPPHMRPGYYPTLSTHNEYLEILGTMGLVGAVPVWIATFGAGWLVLLVLRRPGMSSQARGGDSGLSPGRWAGRFAAVGALTLLATHAGMDLDWLWPVLLGAGAIAVGVLHADLVSIGEGRARGSAFAAMAASVALAVLTATGVIVQQTTVQPWDLPTATEHIVRAVAEGEVDDARVWQDAVAQWNPGSYEAAMTWILLAYVDGEASAAEVAASIDPRGVRFVVQVRVAELLVNDGEVQAAQQVLDQMRPHLAAAHPIHSGRQASYVIELAVAAERDGCDAVRELWAAELRQRVEDDRVEVDEVARAWELGRGGDCPLQ